MKTSKRDLRNLVITQAREAGMRAAWSVQALRESREMYTPYHWMYRSDLKVACSIFSNLRIYLDPSDWRLVIETARAGAQSVLRKAVAS